MDKKKIIGLVILVILLLAIIISCSVLGGNEPVDPTEPTPSTQGPTEPQPTEPEPTQPEPTEPAWVPGVVRATYGGAIEQILSLGDTVTVKGEFDGYYIIAGEVCDLLIETRYVRLATEDPFAERTGYSYGSTPVYKTAYLEDEEVIATLSRNTKLTIVEGKEDWLHVKWNGGEGYVYNLHVSSKYLQSGSGSQSQDGTDINIGGLSLTSQYYGPAFTDLENPCQGTVLTDHCEAYKYLYNRGDIAKVLEVDEEKEECLVMIAFEEGEAITAIVPRWLVRLDGDADYEAWTGYTSSSAVLFSKEQLRKMYALETFKRNTEVKVIDALPDCYVVEINGVIGYMGWGAVNKEPVSSGGSSGTTSGPEWTPPAM